MKLILIPFLSTLFLSQISVAQTSNPLCSFTNANISDVCCHSSGCTSTESGHTCDLVACNAEATADNKQPGGNINDVATATDAPKIVDPAQKANAVDTQSQQNGM